MNKISLCYASQKAFPSYEATAADAADWNLVPAIGLKK